jgi:hypothetical protein
MDKVMDKIERWKLLADLFIKNNSRVFIKEINGDLHFCDIILVGEDTVEIENFAPEQRQGKRERIYWVEIETFEEYSWRKG